MSSKCLKLSYSINLAATANCGVVRHKHLTLFQCDLKAQWP